MNSGEQVASEIQERQDSLSAEISGRFTLRREIGRGHSSVVYAAADKLLDREVALKILTPSFNSENTERALARFRKEAKALSSLKHPNIIQVFSHSCNEKDASIAMELLEGKTLEAAFKEEGRLNVERFEEIFAQVLEAFIYAHSKKVIHRDIKPANIMLVQDGAKTLVKVLDFGLSKSLEPLSTESGSSSNLEQSKRSNTISSNSSGSEFAGSPAYMSPEQCAQKTCDERSDLYSLACVMYEAIAGRTPFNGATAAETMYLHMNAELPPLDEISGSQQIPVRLVETIFSALAKNHNQRPSNASEFKTMVLKALQSDKIAKPKAAARDVLTRTAILISIIVVAAFGLTPFLFKEYSLRRETHKQIDKSISPNIQTTPIRLLKEAFDARQGSLDYAKSIALLNKLRSSFNKSTPKSLVCQCELELAQTYNQFAFQTKMLNQEKKARELLLLALESCQKVEEAIDKKTVPYTLEALAHAKANALTSLGRSDEAISTYQKTEQLLKERKVEPREMQKFLCDYGTTLISNKRNKEGIEMLQRCFALIDRDMEKRTTEIAATAEQYYDIAARRLGLLEQSEKQLKKTISDATSDNPYKSNQYPRVILKMANILQKLGREQEAYQLYIRAIKEARNEGISEAEVSKWEVEVLKIFGKNK